MSARRPSQTRNLKQRPKPSPVPQSDGDIIILSSDDDIRPARTKKVTQNKTNSKRNGKAKVVIPVGDVLEITSEEEGGYSSQKLGSGAPVAELQNKLNRLERENSQLRRDSSDYKLAKMELLELRAARKADQAKLVLDASQIEDIITCEICALKMWDPYTLACGHTFCQSCLEDWFNTTLVQYMAAHPNYNPRGLPLHTPPAPHYTCPTCRTEVKAKPAEAFALKSIVRTIANAIGEKSPRKAGAVKKNGSGTAREGPWDVFFGAPLIR